MDTQLTIMLDEETNARFEALRKKMLLTKKSVVKMAIFMLYNNVVEGSTEVLSPFAILEHAKTLTVDEQTQILSM